MNSTTLPPTILLIPGHWLGAWAWDDVLAHLEGDRARTVAVTLPGLDADDSERTTRTLDDQVRAIRDAITSRGDVPAILVAHSGANAPVTLLLDRNPELVDRVIWVDSGPVSDSSAFAPDLPVGVDDLPLPSFDDLGRQASLEGLSDAVLARFREHAVPEPGPILREAVALSNDARHGVPTTLVCCSISGTQLQQLVQAGHPMFAEVGRLADVEVVDLPTGHWPMWSRPRELADVIRSVAAKTA